jgi:hypothetical protein
VRENALRDVADDQASTPSLAPPEQKLLSRSVADWLAARIIAGEALRRAAAAQERLLGAS